MTTFRRHHLECKGDSEYEDSCCSLHYDTECSDADCRNIIQTKLAKVRITYGALPADTRVFVNDQEVLVTRVEVDSDISDLHMVRLWIPTDDFAAKTSRT